MGKNNCWTFLGCTSLLFHRPHLNTENFGYIWLMCQQLAIEMVITDHNLRPKKRLLWTIKGCFAWHFRSCVSNSSWSYGGGSWLRNNVHHSVLPFLWEGWKYDYSPNLRSAVGKKKKSLGETRTFSWDKVMDDGNKQRRENFLETGNQMGTEKEWGHWLKRGRGAKKKCKKASLRHDHETISGVKRLN